MSSIHFIFWQVGGTSFSIYRHIFRDGFVNGQMLLNITDDILQQNKISNVWHRQSILFAVAQLRTASNQLSTGQSHYLGEVLFLHGSFALSLYYMRCIACFNSVLDCRRAVGPRHLHFVSRKRWLRFCPASQSAPQIHGL